MQKILNRIFWIVVNPIRKMYWFLFRPRTRGVKCLVEHHGKILFVRLGYAHKGWTIPGGKVERGESFEVAAQRELFEETGITGTHLFKIGEYDSSKEFKRDHVEVFYSEALSPDFTVDDFEIIEAKWADPAFPPQPSSPRLSFLMKMFFAFKGKK